MTNASASLIQQYHYDPYGNATTSASTTNPYLYTGREADTASLYYYRARYYSSGMGRFISEDTLKFASGQNNFYAYAGEDPTLYSDPSGNFIPEAIVGGLTGALWGAVGDVGTILCGQETLGGFAEKVGYDAATGALIGATDDLSLIAEATLDTDAAAGNQLITGDYSSQELVASALGSAVEHATRNRQQAAAH